MNDLIPTIAVFLLFFMASIGLCLVFAAVGAVLPISKWLAGRDE